MARDIEKISLQVYEEASIFAAEQGIIIADTKLEFGIDRSTDPPSLVLIDELLTPDSSRFWSVEGYKIGKSQESFDKQYLRGRSALFNHWSNVEPWDRLACSNLPKRAGRCYYARPSRRKHPKALRTGIPDFSRQTLDQRMTMLSMASG